MVNYYRRFLPRLAHIICPLTDSLSCSRTEFSVRQEMLHAIQKIKHAIANTTLLVHPVWNTTLSITTDAFDTAIAGVLHQLVRGRLQPLSFLSRRRTDPETKYITYDKELLAAAASVKKFLHQIEGRRLVIYTDHKPLTTAMSRANSSSAWPLRAERHLLFISQFTTDLRHVAGEANQVADALSRPPLPPPPPLEDNLTNEFDLQEPFSVSPTTPPSTPPPSSPFPSRIPSPTPSS